MVQATTAGTTTTCRNRKGIGPPASKSSWNLSRVVTLFLNRDPMAGSMARRTPPTAVDEGLDSEAR